MSIQHNHSRNNEDSYDSMINKLNSQGRKLTYIIQWNVADAFSCFY